MASVSFPSPAKTMFDLTLVPLVQGEIEKLAKDVDETEIARAHAQIKAGILMSLESTSSRCEQLARQMMVFKRPLSIEEVIAKVDAVDEDALKQPPEGI